MAGPRELPDRLVVLLYAIRLGHVHGVVDTRSKWLWSAGKRVNRSPEVEELMFLRLVRKGPQADGQYTVQLTDRGRAELARMGGLG